jgi:peptidoglycan/xylan/chitin deacetylase (PgdA/CDA1 family)
MVGENARRYPFVVNQVDWAGHRIGNHTMHHIKGWDVKKYQYLEDIEMCQAFLPQEGLFRPPHGRINIKAIPRLMTDYEIIMWDVLAKDWKQDLNVAKQLLAMKKKITNGSILVFHDSEKAYRNLQIMLPEILKYLKKEGYSLEVL